MRILKFIVDNQVIQLDPTCDFDNLVPGTEEYLQAEFSFSPEWRGYTKVASFWSVLGREYQPQILKFGRQCMIPAEALKKRTFKVQVIGCKDGVQLTTNKVAVRQNGGKA